MKNWTSFFLSFLAPALLGINYKGPDGFLSKAKNQATWEKYCIGTADSTEIPEVNYKNARVKKVAVKLSEVADLSFYFYSGPLKAYGLKKGNSLVNAPKSAPKGTTPNANAFLVLLCGEFRDRATMVEAKLKWVENLYLLPTEEQGPIDSNENLWSQVSAHSYRPFLTFSSALWAARKGETEEAIPIGDYEIDAPVDGLTVCETRFIFSEFIAEGKKFPGYGAYKKKWESYSEEYCDAEELETYYNFRGDSNFKPNSPESNGMIWYSSSITNHCESPTEAKGEDLEDGDCEEYFQSPFRNRWNAARAGLAAWLFHPTDIDEDFSRTSNAVTMLPHREGRTQPFTFKMNNHVVDTFMEEWDAIADAWSRGDIGFNEVAQSYEDGFTYERLRDAVNRHTDWYNSGFDDEMGMERDQAYSPFVASSYEMSKSDNFTAPGTTVNSPSDGRKHWMFVFKVKRSHWYNSETLKRKKPVDFDTMWFDETSLGTNSLAKSERAWDRLGTALESELDSILYLHNITTDGSVEDEE